MTFASSPAWAAASAYLAAAAPYLALASALAVVVLVAMFVSLRRRLARLALGRTGSIEESLAILLRDMKDHKQFRTEVEKYLKLAEARLQGALSGIGVVRFNPFGGTGVGGNQSSAVALVDEHGSGVVLSTLYSRDRVAVYTKPVERGGSTYELTTEERAAIDKAKEHVAHTRRGA